MASQQAGPGQGPELTAGAFTTAIAVPAQNAAANVDAVDVVGNKTDTAVGTSIVSSLVRTEATLHFAEEHMHSAALCYPTQAGGVTVISGVGAWALSAAFMNVVPINTIQAPFDIHSIDIENLSANSTYELWLYYGNANTFAGRVRATRAAAGGIEPSCPFQTVIIPANSRVDCKLASVGGAPESMRFTIRYHVY